MNHKTLIVLLLATFPFSGNSQTNCKNDRYKQETKKILSDILAEIDIDSKTLLADSTTTYSLKDGIETIFNDSIHDFSEEEKLFIKNEIENPVVFKWTTEYAENIRLITNRECENIFKDHKNGWNKFRTIYGERIVDVSKPIFIRNYSICILSYSVSEDYLGGYGYTACYRIVDGKWKPLGWMYSWDN
jgi:hypothetical protein